MTATGTPRNLDGWLDAFRDAEIPVYRRTIDALAALRADEDEVSPSAIAAVIQEDPLMTLKLLAFASQHRSARVVTDSETVTSSLVLMGIVPFFRAFDALVSVEERLGGDGVALGGLDEVVRRAYRAANFALGFAVARVDADAEVIQEAALLHDFAEMLLWCHQPALALEIRHRQLADPTLRSAAVQREVLGIELVDLQRALMRDWQLPELLRQITDHGLTHIPRVRNVLLAVRLARHSQRGWDNGALPDDFREIGELLHTSTEYAHRKALELDD